MSKTPTELPSQWCLVGNIIEAHPYGQEHEIRRGSKHFTPGTKVYCLPTRWDGFDRIMVIGLHRGSKRFVTTIMSSEHITNWRAKLIYEPQVLRKLADAAWTSGGRYSHNWSSKEEVETYVRWLNEYERAKQAVVLPVHNGDRRGLKPRGYTWEAC
jgi:hypothetical protein